MPGFSTNFLGGRAGGWPGPAEGWGAAAWFAAAGESAYVQGTHKGREVEAASRELKAASRELEAASRELEAASREVGLPGFPGFDF